MSEHSPSLNVPDDAPAYRCPYCEMPFSKEHYRTLHKGLEHAGRIDDTERDAFQDEYRAESDRIKEFRLKVLGSLVVLYFGILFAYMVLG